MWWNAQSQSLFFTEFSEIHYYSFTQLYLKQCKLDKINGSETELLTTPFRDVVLYIGHSILATRLHESTTVPNTQL